MRKWYLTLYVFCNVNCQVECAVDEKYINENGIVTTIRLCFVRTVK